MADATGGPSRSGSGPIESLRRRWRAWLRGARTAPPFELSDADRRVLEVEFVHWRFLTDDERRRMERLVGAFVSNMRWEAARGFELDATKRLLIAAQACLLLLGLDLDEFPATTSVIVHPRTVVLHGRRGTGVGSVESSGPFPVLGQAHYRGPVVLSWPAVRSGLRWPQRGQNVVFHEFAHQLDMLDGSVDGTPPLDDGAASADLHDRWVEVMTTAYEARRESDGPSVLRPYAGTNPGEFFAVATETFLGRPHELRAAEPALYGVLRSYYGQDPAERLPPPSVAPPPRDGPE